MYSPVVLPVRSRAKVVLPLALPQFPGGLVAFLSCCSVIAASSPNISICSPSSSPGARLACAKGEGKKGVVLRRVCVVGVGIGLIFDTIVEGAGIDAGPEKAGEAWGDVEPVESGRPPCEEVDVEMPMPTLPSCTELAIEMGRVGLCWECCLECKPAAAPLLPTPVPTLVGGLKASSEGAAPPIPPSRADPRRFEEKMCEEGGDEEDEAKDEVEECEYAPRLGA